MSTGYLPYHRAGLGDWLAATFTSSLVHVAILLLSLGAMQQFFGLVPEPKARPNFTITLQRLESDILTGLIKPVGRAGAPDTGTGQAEIPDLTGTDGDLVTPVPAASETAAPNEDPLAVLEPVPPETPPEPKTETTQPEPALAEMPPEPEPEAASPHPAPSETPVRPAPTESPSDAVLGSGASKSLDAVEITQLVSIAPPSPIVPLDGALVATIGTAPTALKPVRKTGDQGAITRVTATGPSVGSLAPVTIVAAKIVTMPTKSTDTTAPPPEPGTQPRPAAQPAPAPSAQDLAIGDLLRRVLATPADACLAALPRRDGASGVGLALIAARDGAMTDFADALLTDEDAGLRQTRTLVDERQCPALAYLRQNRDYPATRLGLRLDAAEVPSGGNLTGVLRGAAGRYLLLLLVDNNGVVQDLQRFVSFSGNFARFDVPVTRTGPQRDTSQLLVAIATERPPNVIRERAGQLARDVFAGLEGEIATGAALTITMFDVR